MADMTFYVNGLKAAQKEFIDSNLHLSFQAAGMSMDDIQREFEIMVSWVKTEPHKGRKKNWIRFIRGWLTRELKKQSGVNYHAKTKPGITGGYKKGGRIEL
jgi:hypothetical protein